MCSLAQLYITNTPPLGPLVDTLPSLWTSSVTYTDSCQSSWPSYLHHITDCHWCKRGVSTWTEFITDKLEKSCYNHFGGLGQLHTLEHTHTHIRHTSAATWHIAVQTQSWREDSQDWCGLLTAAQIWQWQRSWPWWCHPMSDLHEEEEEAIAPIISLHL